MSSANLSLYHKMVKDLKTDVNLVSFSYSASLDEVTMNLLNIDFLNKLIVILKEKYEFQQMLDICGVDFLQQSPRFQIIYQFLSITQNWRLTLKIAVQEKCPSISHHFQSASWYEREIWDLYGVYFIGNDDMRRILTDYNFQGHPLRKDFPLFGYEEVRYSEEKEKIVYEPVSLTQDNLTQEYREFDFRSRWKGYLPGDEKVSQ